MITTDRDICSSHSLCPALARMSGKPERRADRRDPSSSDHRTGTCYSRVFIRVVLSGKHSAQIVESWDALPDVEAISDRCCNATRPYTRKGALRRPTLILLAAAGAFSSPPLGTMLQVPRRGRAPTQDAKLTFWDWFKTDGDKLFTFLSVASLALHNQPGIPVAFADTATVIGVLAIAAHQSFFPNSPQEKSK
jgi:hypothetical protein